MALSVGRSVRRLVTLHFYQLPVLRISVHGLFTFPRAPDNIVTMCLLIAHLSTFCISPFCILGPHSPLSPFGQRLQRGLSPVEYSGTSFVSLSVHPSLHPYGYFSFNRHPPFLSPVDSLDSNHPSQEGRTKVPLCLLRDFLSYEAVALIPLTHIMPQNNHNRTKQGKGHIALG